MKFYVKFYDCIDTVKFHFKSYSYAKKFLKRLLRKISTKKFNVPTVPHSHEVFTG